MTIDIINYTEAQYAALSAVKLQEVREAQMKKNALVAKLESQKAKEKARLIDRGIFPSSIWARREAELTEACEAEINVLRETLLFYLHYANEKGTVAVPDGVPYPVDYSLSEVDRMLALKSYYENAYTDDTERFNAFVDDEFARTYLGERYGSLYHYFEDLKNF